MSGPIKDGAAAAGFFAGAIAVALGVVVVWRRIERWNHKRKLKRRDWV